MRRTPPVLTSRLRQHCRPPRQKIVVSAPLARRRRLLLLRRRPAVLRRRPLLRQLLLLHRPERCEYALHRQRRVPLTPPHRRQQQRHRLSRLRRPQAAQKMFLPSCSPPLDWSSLATRPPSRVSPPMIFSSCPALATRTGWQLQILFSRRLLAKMRFPPGLAVSSLPALAPSRRFF